MGDHSRGVTRNHLAAESSLDEGYWDDVFRELSYYEGQKKPWTEATGEGREVGEIDVLAVNYEDKTFLYIEVKTSWSDLKYAEDQLERADKHFDDWDMIGQKYLEK